MPRYGCSSTEVAQEIVRWAGRELGDLAVGVIHQLSFENLTFEVVLAGSLFKGGHLLHESLQEYVRDVAPGACFIRLTQPPVVGGVLLGMESAGEDFSGCRNTLLKTTTAYFA